MDELKESLSSLEEASALLLAAAVADLCPHGSLLSSGRIQNGFYADFCFREAFSAELLPFLSDRMHQIKELYPLEKKEMIGGNAAQFLKSCKNPLQAKSLRACKNQLVSIAAIGPFAARAPLLEYPKWTSFPPFRLIGTAKAGRIILDGKEREINRIFGTFNPTLKLTVRGKNHAHLGAQLDLFTIDKEMGATYLPKGMELRALLFSYWKRLQLHRGAHIVSTPAHLDVLKMHKNLFEKKGFAHIAEWRLTHSNEVAEQSEGLLTQSSYFSDRSHIFSKQIKPAIEAIKQILTNFSLQGELVLTRADAQILAHLKELDLPYTLEKKEGPTRLTLFASDYLKKLWPISFLERHASGITYSLFDSIDRFIALLLEQSQGELSHLQKEISQKKIP